MTDLVEAVARVLCPDAFNPGLLGREIALFAFIAILGIGAGCYALSKVGKSRSIPVNLGCILLFGMGSAIGGVFGLIAVMGSV